MDVESLYDRYYGGDKARRGLFDAVAAWRSFDRVLYPGSFVHVTAAFVFPAVVFVDTDRRAARFFAEQKDVVALVRHHKQHAGEPNIRFHSSSYDVPLAEPDGSFNLLISLYAGFISAACKRYLAVGGTLLVNNSHGDAGLAQLDEDYALVGVVVGRGDRLRVREDGLDAYFQSKRPVDVTPELLRERGRGLGYRKTATAYLFRRVR